MPVIVSSEEHQRGLIETFNRDKQPLEKIPLVQRNLNSGWPLLQVAIYSHVFDTESSFEQYEPALGGGKCCAINIGTFHLACLLTKIPGTMQIKIDSRTRKRADKIQAGEREAEQLRLENVRDFLKGYSIRHLATGITLASHQNGYGYLIAAEIPVGNANLLESALYHVFNFAVPYGDILEHAGYNSNQSYTQGQIQKALDPDVATFSNGQIFVDFGDFIVKNVQDKEILSYFRNIFKVTEFNACMLGLKPEITRLRDCIHKIQESSVPPNKAYLASELDCQLNTFLCSWVDKPYLFSSKYLGFKETFQSTLFNNNKLFTGHVASRVLLLNIQNALAEMDTLFNIEKVRFFSQPSPPQQQKCPTEPHRPRGAL